MYAKVVIWKAATLVVTIILAATIVFFVVSLLPGDAAEVALGLQKNPEALRRLREALGLDQPLQVRYFVWLSRFLTGNLGESIYSGEPVAQMIATRLPVTVTLALLAMIFGMLIGIPAGVVAAIRRGKAADFAASLSATVGISVPGFWLGIVMILVFSIWLKIAPSGGYVNPSEDPFGWLSHLILPSLAVGLILSSYLERMVRSSLLEVLPRDYILAARAKGLSEYMVIFKHALKNSMIPVVTAAGLQLGTILGGIIYIEEVFQIDGLGRLLLNAVAARDFPVVQAVALTMTLFFVATNLAVDLLVSYVDPRISYR
jgi:peptide/nickel transport system permease protein